MVGLSWLGWVKLAWVGEIWLGWVGLGLLVVLVGIGCICLVECVCLDFVRCKGLGLY